MPLPDPPYRPIDCGFYDRIERAAVRGAATELVYLAPDGSRAEQRTHVVDVFSRDGAEFLRLEGGTEVRLDRLLALDGVPRPGASAGDTCARTDGEI